MKTTINPTRRVTKKHIGRPADFLGFDGKVYNGRVESIRRGYVEFLYHVPGQGGEFRTLVKVHEKRLEVY
jgi:hypothetical protein